MNNPGDNHQINQVSGDDLQYLPSQVQLGSENNGSQGNRNDTGASVAGSHGNSGSAFNGNRGS